MSGEGHRARSQDERGKVDAGEQPGGRIGRYVIVSRLGEGAMGMVYLAYDPKLDRRLALKVLRRRSRSSRNTRERQQRLRREAQAMAQLNHPHVVTVHDVGVAEGRVFLAMDYVPGQDLRDWLEARRRRWNKVLRTFIYAGRGLAAAHAAGVIHRDFKPENVLVGEDGAVKVMDFGLARPGGEGSSRSSFSDTREVPDEGPAERARTAAAQVIAASPDDDADDERDWWRQESDMIDVDGCAHLTRSGDVLGTPSYMAPELFAGGDATVSTDQFAFCVALYEGLYGVRPFAGESMAALAFNMNQERITPGPRGSRVPVWLGRLVRRGLALDPARRYPSMDDLLDALIQGAARRRLRRAGAAAVGLVLAGGGLSYALVPTPTPCQGGEDRIREVWNDERSAAIAAAFEATGVPYADEALTRAQQRLDDYAESWVGVYTSVCEATAVHKEQTPQQLDRRIACLDDRLAELDALLGVLGEADQRVAEHAAQAASELRGPSTCGTESLAERPEAADPEHQRQVDTLRGRLLRAEALEHAGRYDDAITLAQEIAAEAELLGETRLHGEALVLLGMAEDMGGDYAAATQHLRKAYFMAHEAGLDEVAAHAAVQLITAEGIHLAHTDEGLSWARHAQTAFERSSPTSPLRSHYHKALGSLYMKRLFELSKAREHYQQALALERQSKGEDHEHYASILGYLGSIQGHTGESEQAVDSFEKAIAITRRALGPQHPELAILHNNYAVALSRRPDLPGAQAQFEKALAIHRQTLGEHPATATGIDNLGAMMVMQDKYEPARPLLEEALAMRERVLEPDHPDIANSLTNLAAVLEHDNDLGGARRYYERALSILEKTDGPNTPQYGLITASIGLLALREGMTQQGHDRCTRALEVLDPLLGDEDPEQLDAMACLAWAKLELREPQAALELLEKAYDLRDRGQPQFAPLVSLLLSRALTSTGGDGKRASALRAEARRGYADQHDEPPERLVSWLGDPQ